jgi:hypothetical protein
MPSSRCKRCDQPLVEIDNYGDRLTSAALNAIAAWRGGKQPIELAEDDLEALRVVKVAARSQRG